MQGIIDSCCQHHAILIDWLILFYFYTILAVSGPEADCRYLPKYYGGPHDTPLDNPYSVPCVLFIPLIRKDGDDVIDNITCELTGTESIIHRFNTHIYPGK